MSLLLVENPDALTLPLGNTLASCEKLLNAAGPVEGAHVAVIGDGGLPVLCGLIRRGAAAAAEVQLCDRGHVDGVEIAIIPALADIASAGRAIALASRALLACGRVVVNIPIDSAQGSMVAQHARTLLARAGFAIIQFVRASDGFIITADKPLLIRAVHTVRLNNMPGADWSHPDPRHHSRSIHAIVGSVPAPHPER